MVILFAIINHCCLNKESKKTLSNQHHKGEFLHYRSQSQKLMACLKANSKKTIKVVFETIAYSLVNGLIDQLSVRLFLFAITTEEIRQIIFQTLLFLIYIFRLYELYKISLTIKAQKRQFKSMVDKIQYIVLATKSRQFTQLYLQIDTFKTEQSVSTLKFLQLMMLRFGCHLYYLITLGSSSFFPYVNCILLLSISLFVVFSLLNQIAINKNIIKLGLEDTISVIEGSESSFQQQIPSNVQ